MSQTEFHISLPDANATVALGGRLGRILERGDVVFLIGDLGAGKTTLARGAICAFVGQSIEAPSPTYTLVQTYPGPEFELWHFDLYRLQQPEDLEELGWDDAQEQGACLIEWPDRMNAAPTPRLDIRLTASGEGRAAHISGTGPWMKRARALATP